MSLAPSNISKFRTRFVGSEKNRGLYKEVDFAHLMSVFPNLQSFKMLDPGMKDILSTARPNIIGEDGTLMAVFEDKAVIEDWYHDTIIWRLYTQDGDNRPTVLKNYQKGVKYSGVGETTIKVVLDTDAFGPHDMIAFEDLRTIQFLIVSEPIPDGSHMWEYEMVISASDIEYVEDFYELVPEGTQVMQGISPIPEDTTHRGNVLLPRGGSYLEFETLMGRVGWSMKITDKAWLAANDFVLNANCKEAEDYMEAQGYNGKQGILGNDLELGFITATNRLIDYHITYGRTNGQFAGNQLDIYNHRPLNVTGGLYQFMEQGIIREYNPEVKNGFDILSKLFQQAWLNKNRPEDTSVHVFTGSGGMELVQKWGRNADELPIMHEEKTNYDFMPDAYKQGRKGVIVNKKQYRGYYMEPYGKVIFHYLPFLDNTYNGSKKKRYKGWPLESYQFIVFDFGYGDVRDGKNIRIFQNPHVEAFGYGTGTWGPDGTTIGKTPMYPTTLPGENAYELIRESSLGFLIKDVSNLLWLVPGVSL